MKDCIQDFVAAWKSLDSADGISKHIHWDTRFQDAGYFSVEFNALKNWQEVHEWCRRWIGEEHYSWTGSVFWFESEKAASWFALKWS